MAEIFGAAGSEAETHVQQDRKIAGITIHCAVAPQLRHVFPFCACVSYRTVGCLDADRDAVEYIFNSRQDMNSEGDFTTKRVKLSPQSEVGVEVIGTLTLSWMGQQADFK